MRFFSIFKLFRKIPESVIYKILELFTLKKQNAKKITIEIKDKYNKNVKYDAINKTLYKFRQIITEFIKIKYKSIILVDLTNIIVNALSPSKKDYLLMMN